MKFIEYEIQCNAVAWMRLQYPNAILHSIPNGARVGIRQAVRLKKEGLLKSIPDVFVAQANTDYHGIYAETKRPGAKPNRDQKIMMERLSNRGYFVFWYDNLEDFIHKIKWYMKLDKEE